MQKVVMVSINGGVASVLEACWFAEFDISYKSVKSIKTDWLSLPQLQQCACSNVVGLLGALFAFCLYCYSLSAVPNEPCVMIQSPSYEYRQHTYCPGEVLEVSLLFSMNFCYVQTLKRLRSEGISVCDLWSSLQAYTWSVILLLILYDSGAVILHGFLSVSAIKALKATWHTHTQRETISIDTSLWIH